MFRHYLILSLLDRFKGERSSSAVFHLLKGKRTSQTIQDGFTYGVHPFFGSFQSLTREDFEKPLTFLITNDFIKEDNNQCGLTDKGKEELARLQKQYTLPEGLNGWHVGTNRSVFWSRLTLVIHTLSHLLHGVKHYIPVTGDPETLEWGKRFFLSSPYKRYELADQLYKELLTLFGTRSELERTLLVHRLTGYKKDGVTFDQLSRLLNKEKDELLLDFQAGIDGCVMGLLSNESHYPILNRFIESFNTKKMTRSAQETYKWFKQGWSIEAIAQKRGLKPSTIQDHVIEISRIEPKAITEALLPSTINQSIKSVLKANPTRRLSELKKELTGDISYFQIRLSLAIQEVELNA